MSSILADQLELWGFEQDTIIYSDGSQGFGLELVPLDVSCWDDERLNSLAQKCAQFLNGLPDGLDLQFVQDIEGGNERLLKVHESSSDPNLNAAARSLTQERVARYREYDAQGLLPRHTLKVFVRRKGATALVDRSKIFSRSKKFEPIAEERFRHEIASLGRIQENMIESFKSLGLTSRVLTADEVATLLYRQWNPARDLEKQEINPEDARSSLLYTDIGIYECGFSAADVHHRVISLKTLPEQTFSAMAEALRGLPFDSRLFLSIHVPNQQKELEALQTQRRVAFSLARGKRTGIADLESEAKLEDLETLLEQMVARGEKVFHVSLQILLRSKNKDELDSYVSQTLATLRELSGAEGMEESLAAFPLFCEASIPNARSRERSRRVKTSNLCDLLPIYGPWRGFDPSRILLRTRQGSLLGFDPFHSELTNANQLISGGSGAGKSFLTNILLLQMLKENPKIYFVDIGGSYKKICENLAGQYLPLQVDQGISMNPFDLLPGEKAPSSEKIKFLLGFLELITKEEGHERLPRLERAELEEVIHTLYGQSSVPKLSELQALLLSHPETTLKRLGRVLSPWCGDTPYGRFVDRTTTVELQRPLVAFDLKGLESFPDLQSACLYLLTDFIWRQVQNDLRPIKFLVFDECWKLLKDDSALVFIEGVFRTFRKYNASAVAISQDIADFAHSKIAEAILPNCSVKWILIQNQSGPKRVQEILHLNENEMELIRSLNQKKGIYSEAFLMAQNYRSIVVVESTPLEYWIATTDPKDLIALDGYQTEHPDLTSIDALKELALRYPSGVAASRSFVLSL